jgi:hypothetical protein
MFTNTGKFLSRVVSFTIFTVLLTVTPVFASTVTPPNTPPAPGTFYKLLSTVTNANGSKIETWQQTATTVAPHYGPVTASAKNDNNSYLNSSTKRISFWTVNTTVSTFMKDIPAPSKVLKTKDPVNHDAPTSLPTDPLTDPSIYPAPKVITNSGTYIFGGSDYVPSAFYGRTQPDGQPINYGQWDKTFSYHHPLHQYPN